MSPATNRSAQFLPKWFSILLVIAVCTIASAQKPKQPPAPQHSAPAPHAAPAPKPAQSAPHQAAPSNASHNNQSAPHGNTSSGGSNNAHGSNNAAGANNAHGSNASHTNASGGASNNAAGNNNAHGANNTAGGHNNAHGANNAGGNNNARGANNAAGSNNNARGANNAAGANNNARGGPGANNARGGNNAAGANNARAANARGGAVAARRGPPTTTREIKTRSGATVQASYRGGHVRTIQAHNMRIDRGFRGERRVVTERNGRRIVTVGRGRGYMERPYFNRGGRAYYQRTYYYGGRRYAYAYRGYYYHGARYYGYAPAYYYHPAYYGWAYNPWPAPAYYRWGYYNDPWYGQYNYYYQPYPAYPTASSWVTDYMISENLRAAYEARLNSQITPAFPFADHDLVASLGSSDILVAATLRAAYGGMYYAAGKAAAASTAPVQLSPEVKQLIADEVKQEIADEKAAVDNPKQTAAAGTGDETPPALDSKHHIFVVASDLDVTADDGTECALTQGDVIQRTGDDVDEDNNVDVLVKSSKKDDCAAGTKTAVDAGDLQEMYNHFREVMDAGMKSLADNSGKNGLPAAPDTATTPGEVPAPTADTNVDTELQQQQKEADQTESEVQQDPGGNQ